MFLGRVHSSHDPLSSDFGESNFSLPLDAFVEVYRISPNLTLLLVTPALGLRLVPLDL